MKNAMKCPDCEREQELSQNDIPGSGQFIERVCLGCGLRLKVERGKKGELLAKETGYRQV